MLESKPEGSPLLCNRAPVPAGPRGSVQGSVPQTQVQCRCQSGYGGWGSRRVPVFALQSVDRLREMFPLGGAFGGCLPTDWMRNPATVLLGNTGVHHHLPERCLNLTFFQGCAWDAFIHLRFGAPGTWLHIAGGPSGSRDSSVSCRDSASPRAEKSIFSLSLVCSITWHMGHSSSTWHCHLAQAKP